MEAYILTPRSRDIRREIFFCTRIYLAAIIGYQIIILQLLVVRELRLLCATFLKLYFVLFQVTVKNQDSKTIRMERNKNDQSKKYC